MNNNNIKQKRFFAPGVADMPPPLIAVGGVAQTLPLSTEAEIPCEARGTPEPLVSWAFRGRPLNPSKRHHVSPLGTLRITGKPFIYLIIIIISNLSIFCLLIIIYLLLLVIYLFCIY